MEQTIEIINNCPHNQYRKLKQRKFSSLLQDAHKCILDFDEETSLFSVYDGHEGAEVAKYTSEKLPEFIKKTEEYKSGNYKEALISAFLNFDETLRSRHVLARLKEIMQAEKGDDLYGRRSISFFTFFVQY